MAATPMKNIIFTIATVDYSTQVRKIRLVPEQQVITYKTLNPAGTISDQDAPVWTLELEGLQDNESGGLAAALRTAYDTDVAVVFSPQTGTGKKKVTLTVHVPAIPFGGEQGAFLDMDLSLPVQGQPTFGTNP